MSMDTCSEIQSLILEAEVQEIEENGFIEIIDCVDYFNDYTRLYQFADEFGLRKEDDPLPPEEKDDFLEWLYNTGI